MKQTISMDALCGMAFSFHGARLADSANPRMIGAAPFLIEPLCISLEPLCAPLGGIVLAVSCCHH